MGNILSVDRLSKTAGDKTLFSDISFGLEEGEKVGLIGINGCGKSTLLKLLAGLETPDSGSIVCRRGLGLSYLAQIPEFDPAHSIREHLFEQGSPVLRLIERYQELCGAAGEAAREKWQREIDDLLEKIEAADAFGWEEAIASILRELGLGDLNQPMRELSGGKLKKVALAEALIRPAGLLLLDEPTNHLDIDTILWLERYLEKSDRALILVTHDRYFLDKVVSRTFEIEDGRLYKYSGPYHFFLEKKAERLALSERIRAKQKSFLAKELEWLKRQPKARGTKQKARIERFQKIESLQKAPSKMELSFSVSGRRLGKRILEVKNISKSFGDQLLFENFSWFFKQNERIGIVGPNGSGKSTFLNILTGRIEPDSGSVNKGVHTRFGYFDQTGSELDSGERVLSWVKREIGEWMELADGTKKSASELLSMFAFSGQMQSSAIHRLSGGEKRRLQLVAVLLANPNFLILDEPTNDLDVDTLSRLEEFLQNYPGCLLIVSHDRYFMDRVVDELFVFDGNGLSAFPSNFSDYLDYKKFQESRNRSQAGASGDFGPDAKAVLQGPASRKRRRPPRERKKKAGFNEKRELAELEDKIASAESRKAEIEAELTGGAELKHTALQELTTELASVTAELEASYLRWEELMALMEE